MKLALYSSVPKLRRPNLVALQDEALTALPTVLVCPLKAGIALTALRVEVPWGEDALIACCDLARPIRRAPSPNGMAGCGTLRRHHGALSPSPGPVARSFFSANGS